MSSLRLRRDNGAGIEVDRDRSVLGRDAACEVVVEDKSVSRRHLLIERRGEDWAVVDQGSANGTYLDGRRVQEAVLRNGQQLRLGSVVLRVEIEEAAPATVLMSAPELEGATVMMTSLGTAPPPPERPAPPTPPAAPVPPPVARRAAPPPVAVPPIPPQRPSAPRATPAAAPRPAPAAEDPLALLGLGPGASAEEVRARYEEVSQELQAKLAGAHNANLRSTYERNLVALHQAFRHLSRGSEPFGDVADLPSAQPVVAAEMIDGSGVMKRTAAEEIPLGEAAAAKGSESLLPPATSVLVFAATVLLAMTAFFALSKGKLVTAVKKLDEAPELVNARQAAARLAPTETLLKAGAFRNGKLRLCNRASRPLEIDWLSAVYISKTDVPAGADPEFAKLASGFKLGTYNSGFCGSDFHLVLSPGSEQAVELRSQEGRCNFDGAAVFYALSVQRPPEVAPSPEAPARPGARPKPAPSPEAEKQPGEPGTTFWQSGLLNGRDACVSVGAGW
jgi:pSer/pThr/pTyr-binding forkhead associated (FHA) protein